MERLRSLIASELASEGVGVLCQAVGFGSRLLPVRYRAAGLLLDCLLPRWVDAEAWFAQGPPDLTLITLPAGDPHLRWLEIQGAAQIVSPMTWPGPLPQHSRLLSPEELYLQIRIRPRRIHRIDEAAGWGIQATLDL